MVSFEKAVLLNPRSFWAYYDLGLMAARDGDCRAAAAGLARALDLPPQETLRSMFASKLYLDLGRSWDDLGKALEQRLKAAYVNAYRLGGLASSCSQAGTPNASKDLQAAASNVQIQIF